MLSAQISLKSCSSGLANEQVKTGGTLKHRGGSQRSWLCHLWSCQPPQLAGPSTACVEEEVTREGCWARQSSGSIQGQAGKTVNAH